MKKRYTEEQIIRILKQAETGGGRRRRCKASKEKKPNPEGLSLGSVQWMGAGHS